ncbi:LOW QUALITY PROTEIN: uncharacterized protein LRP34_002920 [Phaethornis superciliosus]
MTLHQNSERKKSIHSTFGKAEVHPVVKLPAKATSKNQNALVSNATPITYVCLNKESLSFSHKVTPCLSKHKTGKHHIIRAPDSILKLRPPIQEHTVPESLNSEVSKMGRIFCAVEEDVQQEEKIKYKQLLEMVKEKYPRSCPSPQSTNFQSVQVYSKEPVMTVSPLEKQKYGGHAYPCGTPTSLNCTGICSPQWCQRSDMIRYYTPAENSNEQARPVKQAVAVKHRAEISEDLLSHLAPVLSKKSPALDVKGKKFLSLERPEHFSSAHRGQGEKGHCCICRQCPVPMYNGSMPAEDPRHSLHRRPQPFATPIPQHAEQTEPPSSDPSSERPTGVGGDRSERGTTPVTCKSSAWGVRAKGTCQGREAARSAAVFSHREDNLSMVSTRAKAIAKKNVATQIELPWREAAVQV